MTAKVKIVHNTIEEFIDEALSLKDTYGVSISEVRIGVEVKEFLNKHLLLVLKATYLMISEDIVELHEINLKSIPIIGRNNIPTNEEILKIMEKDIREFEERFKKEKLNVIINSYHSF